MCPVLFHLFGVPVPAYGVAFVAAVGLTLLIGRARAPSFGLAPSTATDFMFWGAIGAWLCAKLMYAFVLLFSGRFDLEAVLKGGGVFYGGVFGALTSGALFARLHGASFWDLGDAVIPGGTIAHAVGRFGCFMAGCCYGQPTGSSWGVTFTSPLAARVSGTPLGVPLHPVQLYEVGVELGIGLFLLALTKHRPFPGIFFPTYLLLYSPARFVIEGFRSDFRGEWFGQALSTSQVLSSVALVVGVFALARMWQSRGEGPHRSRPRAGGTKPGRRRRPT